jgi:hypothetical protein
MKKNKIVIMVAATIGLVTIAWLTSRNSTSESAPDRMGEPLLKGINIDEIASITMIGTSTSSLVRTENGWVVPEKFNYPANYDRLHRAVVSLDNVKIEQALTLSDKQKADMHIDANSPRIQMRDKNDKILLEVVLGDIRQSNNARRGPYGGMPTGRFISTDGGKSVVVVSETFYSFDNPAPKGWLATELCNLPATEIDSIRISTPGADTISLKSDKDHQLKLEGLKAGDEVDTAKLSGVKNALSYLNLDDIADPKLNDKELGMDKPVIFEAQTKSNLLYVVKLGAKANDSGARYARINVTYAEPKLDDGKADDNAKVTAEATKAKAHELNAKLSKWTYILPSYKVKDLTKARSDLLKAKPAAAKPAAPAGPAPAIKADEQTPAAKKKPEPSVQLTKPATDSKAAPTKGDTDKSQDKQSEPEQDPADK